MQDIKKRGTNKSEEREEKGGAKEKGVEGYKERGRGKEKKRLTRSEREGWVGKEK